MNSRGARGHEKFIYVNLRGARRHEKFMDQINKVKTKGIFLPKSEIQTFFPAENRCSPKKKDLHPKNVMKSGVSPQKIRKYRKHQFGSRFALQ